jgi:hypothetical protein
MTEEKKTKSASKPTNPLSLVRGSVGERKNMRPIRLALESAKHEAKVQDFARLYGLARISPLLRLALPAAGPSRRVNSVQATVPLEPAGLSREVAWVANVLEVAAPIINSFFPLRDQVASLTMQGRYGEATLVLNRIDHAYGLSLWSVESRVALLALQAGFDNQKPFVNALTRKFKKSFLAFFAANVSERNESRVTSKGYERRLRERARSWSIPEAQKKYIFYKLLRQLPTSASTAASILAYEASSSTIDLYETFVSIVGAIRYTPAASEEGVRQALSSLASIEDHCIANLLTLYGTHSHGDQAPLEPAYLSAFFMGDYAVAADGVESVLRQDPNDSVAFVTSCLLAMLVDRAISAPGSVVGRVHELYAALKGPRANSADAADELEKLSRNLQHLPVSSTIGALAVETKSHELLPMARDTAVRTSSHTAQTLGALMSRTALDAGGATTNSIGAGSSLQYQRLSQTGALDDAATCQLSAEARAFAMSSYYANHAQYENALIECGRLRESAYPYYRDEGMIREAWLLYNSGAVLESLRLSAQIAISRPAQDRALPLVAIIVRRGFRDLKEAQAELSLSIAFQQYSRLVGDSSKDVALKVAWKQLLRSHSVDRPSDLQDKVDRFDLNQLVYFLQEVCTQEVMELGGAFNSPGDLDSERLKICLLLRKLDPSNALQYDAEVLELTRRLSIEEGVRQVDSSRIYVDVVGVERWCQAHLGESFLRYLDYVGAGLQSTVEDLERRLVQLMKGGSDVRDIGDFLSSYDVSADSILQDVLETAAVAFMTLPRYGLDAFLGSRVRHGSLEGVFRSPLERLKLITKIDSRTNEYESNDYWLNSIEWSDAGKREAFSRVLRSLSKNIDAILDSAVGRYVYVRSEANKDGLISLWQSEELKRQQLLYWVIQSKVMLSTNPGLTLSMFIEHCAYSIFWPALGGSLERVQNFATEELASTLIKCLDAAEREAAALVSPARLTGFSSRLRAARIEVSNSATKLASWFHVPKEQSKSSSYLLKTAMEIGLISTSRIWPDFNIDVEWNVDEAANVPLVTPAFETINDVSYLIFGNIAKHSGFFGRGEVVRMKPKVRIDIESKESTAIEIRVTSAIEPSVNLAAIGHSVEQAKATIAQRRYEEVVSRTRGTGLVRMASTLNYEGNDEKKLDFGLTDDAEFFVSFTLPVYVLTDTKHR